MAVSAELRVVTPPGRPQGMLFHSHRQIPPLHFLEGTLQPLHGGSRPNIYSINNKAS